MKPIMGAKNYKNKNKPKTQQGKQITRNASLSLIQNWKHKDAKQEHNIC
jgi:hypothetical protein